MVCSEVKSLLAENVDGVYAAEVENHLAACLACQREQRLLTGCWRLLDEWPSLEPSPQFSEHVAQRVQSELERTWTALGSWPDVEPSAGFADKVVRAATAAPSLQPLPVSRARWWQRPSLVSRLGAVAAALMIGCSLFLVNPSPQSTPALDDVVTTWDFGRRAAVLDDLPSYVAEEDLLPAYEHHRAQQDVGTDEILEEHLAALDPGDG